MTQKKWRMETFLTCFSTWLMIMTKNECKMMCLNIMPDSVNFLQCVMLRTSTVSSISNLSCICVYACDMCVTEKEHWSLFPQKSFNVDYDLCHVPGNQFWQPSALWAQNFFNRCDTTMSTRYTSTYFLYSFIVKGKGPWIKAGRQGDKVKQVNKFASRNKQVW